MTTACCRKSVFFGLLAAGIMLAGSFQSANAQGLFDALFGPAPGRMESFCHRGINIAVERFDPSGDCRYPALIVLHGSDGADARAAEYRQVANMASQRGYVVFLVHYFDATGTCPDDPSISQMKAPEFNMWVSTVRAAISYAAAQGNVDSRRIGLVGFSLGSYVALSVASIDHRVHAVVNLFGGMPDAYARKAKVMPPVISLHGACDEMVPLSEAVKVDRLEKKLGAPSQLIVYPGQSHTFDKATGEDAAERSFAFLQKYL